MKEKAQAPLRKKITWKMADYLGLRPCNHDLECYTKPMIAKKALVLLCSALTFTASSYAQAADSSNDLQISRIGDLELSCGQLSEEAVNMRDLIYSTQDIKDDSKLKSHGISAAGALGSLLIGTATGGIGLAAAGFLMEQGVSNTADKAEDIQDVAQQRRSLMMGVFNAKGCYGPIEHAMQDPIPFDPLERLAAIEASAGNEHIRPKRKRYND